MKSIKNIGLENVQAVYGGPEGDLWELVMGEQIHIGGFQSSMDLAKRAGIGAGMQGIDLCCCSGAGMRFLVKFCKVAPMSGVDATRQDGGTGAKRCQAPGWTSRSASLLANVCATGLPAASPISCGARTPGATWRTRPKLIAEAARLVKPKGLIAFTDWMEGPAGLTDEEAKRYLGIHEVPRTCSA